MSDVSKYGTVSHMNRHCLSALLTVCLQEVQMIDDFSAAVQGTQKSAQWALESLLTQRVLDALFQSAKEGGTMVTVPQTSPFNN